MTPVKPSELHTAARIADALVYAAGLAGVVAGGLLFRDGQRSWAVVAWALTFVAGAALRLASAVARAIAELLARQTQMEQELRDLRGTDVDHGPAERRAPRSPWNWH